MTRKIIQLMGYANDMNGDAKYCLCDDGTVWSRDMIMDPKADSMLDAKRWGWVQLDTSDITTDKAAVATAETSQKLGSHSVP